MFGSDEKKVYRIDKLVYSTFWVKSENGLTRQSLTSSYTNTKSYKAFDLVSM